jgi:hypothetical protein
MRRRLSLLGATMLLVAAMIVASAPPIFAKGGGCHNDKQTSKHLEKLIDCALD